MKRDVDFLTKVRKLAVDNNMSSAARALKIPVYTLRARLLNAIMNLGEIASKFANTRVEKTVANSKKRKRIDTVRAATKAENSNRVIHNKSILA